METKDFTTTTAVVSVFFAVTGCVSDIVAAVRAFTSRFGETSHLGPIALTAGFALFALISVYLDF